MPVAPVLRRVGLVLVIFGLCDITLFAWCMVHQLPYASSISIPAIIAGVYLRRAHLGAVRIVTWFAALLLAAIFGAMLFLVHSGPPLALWQVLLRNEPLRTTMVFSFGMATFAIATWVYRQLRQPAVLEACTDAGQSSAPPRSAFVIGLLCAAGLSIIVHSALRGVDGAKAVQLAEAREGPGYRYFVMRIAWAGNDRRATVLAWNELEIKSVEVTWHK